MSSRTANHHANSGKLRIGDNWNAIRIIAFSQSNPLKAVAEFVENSIDAKAKRITIVRGREHGVHYLKIKDDGEGIRRNAEGAPDFDYVATHICDSVKRRLKQEGATGLQGEYGIGLLSFWTVGEELIMTSAGDDGRAYQMRMKKGHPEYQVTSRRNLLAEPGTELLVRNILPGIKQFSGEKIQWYLASELRDRIRNSGAEVRVIDRTSRLEFKVEPRQFEGRLLHEINKLPAADLYLELYFAAANPANAVALSRNGTRVIENIATCDEFNKPPWTSGYLEGIVDAPFLNLTPGTRTGIIHDEGYQRLLTELEPIEAELCRLIEDQRRAEEEQTSREVLRSIQKALREALLALPAEEYDWFELQSAPNRKPTSDSKGPNPDLAEDALRETPPVEAADQQEPGQKQFFEFPGPLFSVRVSPASSVLGVGQNRAFRAVARDRANRQVDDQLSFAWSIIEGGGQIDSPSAEIINYQAPDEPGLIRLKVTARQSEIECSAEALVTVTQELLPGPPARATRPGIPSYTFQKAPGELWRSRYEPGQNVIVVNNGHRDFVYASRNRALKIRYITRLFAKELVLKNFPGADPAQLLERLIELSLYTEENLK